MSEEPMTWKDGKLIPLTVGHQAEMLTEASEKWHSDLRDAASPIYLDGQKRIGRLQRRRSRVVSLTILGLVIASLGLGFISPLFWLFTTYFLYLKAHEFYDWIQKN